MKTLILMLVLYGVCLAADKPNHQAAAKERQARYLAYNLSFLKAGTHDGGKVSQ